VQAGTPCNKCGRSSGTIRRKNKEKKLYIVREVQNGDKTKKMTEGRLGR